MTIQEQTIASHPSEKDHLLRTQEHTKVNHHPPRIISWCGLCLSVLLLLWHGHQWLQQPTRAGFLTHSQGHNSLHDGLHNPLKVSSERPFFESRPLSAALQESVHAASMTQYADKNGERKTLAVWYGGSREGAQDVQLFLSHQIFGQPHWSEPRALISRLDAQAQLGRYIKKLGNPVLFTSQDGRVWLFFVTVSVGGWAGSAINVMTSDDGGQTFNPPKRLTTSPFLNISTLVRNRPIELEDGGLVLPIYHEFIGKFCELLWLDTHGHVRDKQRLTWGRQTLQPTLVAESHTSAAIFVRVAKPKTSIEMMQTKDGGRTFSPPIALNLPNDNAAIDATITTKGQWVLVYNHDPNGRNKLSLATAPEPSGPWQQKVIVDQHTSARPYARFSYPVLIKDAQAPSTYHLLYTVERQFIEYSRFNEAWLDSQNPLITKDE